MTAPARDPIGLEPTRPGAIVRLSRRGVWALGGVIVTVGVAAIVALQAQGRKGSELRMASVPAPPPEARWYQQQSDALFKPTELPVLSPTPRGESTPSISLAEKAPAKDPLQVRRDQALLRALDSKTLVSEFQKGASKRVAEGPLDHSAAPATPPGLADLRGLTGGSAGGLTADDPNLQERKEGFLKLDGRDEILSSRIRPPLSRFEVKAGSVIPAILVAGIDSDLPGQTIGQVRENVFDTGTGGHLLVPQGTRVVGLYDSHVAYGQERVLVNWKRLIFPNGTSLSLKDGMPGAEGAGSAGFADEVDNHLVGLFGRAILLSAITTGVELSQRGFQDRGGFAVSAPDVASAALGQNLGQVAGEVIRRGLTRQPTLVVRPGYRFNIMVTQDLVLPGPYPEEPARTSAESESNTQETAR